MLRRVVVLLCALVAVSPAIGPDQHAPSPGESGREAIDRGGNPRTRAHAGPLPFFYDLYTFRGTGGKTEVVAAFAVPAGRLEGEDWAGKVRYRFDVTLVLADTALRSVSRTDDSVFVASPRPLAGEHLLYTHIEVQAPPSGSTVERVIMTDVETPGRGQLYEAEFPIPDYSGSELMLSDIALGQTPAGGGWKRGDVTLALLPTSQFPESAFDVFYEIYNLPDGSRYTTEIVIEQVDAAPTEWVNGNAVHLRFFGESAARPDSTVQELRHVSADLGKGRYRLTVTVTDEDTGRSASGSRVFHVRGWRPGATMVAALPRGRT